MNQALIFQPVASLMLLTFLAGIRMYAFRIPFFRRKENNPDQYRTRQVAGSLGDRADAASDNFQNQFELPVVFYILAVSLFLLGKVDPVYLYLAWIFLATRVLHHVIHVTYNRVVHRFLAYTTGMIVLLIMTARFAFQVFSG